MKYKFSLSITKYNEKIYIPAIFLLFYCLNTNFICILTLLLVEYCNCDNKRREKPRLLEGGAYLNVDTRRCGAYWKTALNEVRRLLEEMQ